MSDFSIAQITASAAGFEAELEVPADSSFFEGHFPGHPILPAVAQLVILDGLCRRCEGFPPGGIVSASRLRFQRPVGPGARLDVSWGRPDEQARFGFEFRCAGETVSRGHVEWREIRR